MITEQGLSEQLLATVVAHERPDLQEKKEQLIIESAKNRDSLYTIESKILEVSTIHVFSCFVDIMKKADAIHQF